MKRFLFWIQIDWNKYSPNERHAVRKSCTTDVIEFSILIVSLFIISNYSTAEKEITANVFEVTRFNVLLFEFLARRAADRRSSDYFGRFYADRIKRGRAGRGRHAEILRSVYLCTWTRLRRRKGWCRRPPVAATDTSVRPPDTRTCKRAPCNGFPVGPSSVAISPHTPTARTPPAKHQNVHG